jgi:hypothetical protein
VKITPQKRIEFVAGLRALADFVETAHPDVPIGTDLYTNEYVAYEKFVGANGIEYSGNTIEGMAILATLLRTCDKKPDSNFFNLSKEFGGGVKLIWFADRNAVCERVVVGTKVVPPQPERVIPAEPERIEELVEWHCPSLLKELPRPGSVELDDAPALPGNAVYALTANAEEDYPF